MFYVPDQLWLCVLPINHILGRVPFMKVFLEGSNSPTIPSSLAQQKNTYFLRGHANRAGAEVGGSQLFMLNVHMWEYGRPQPRTMSVEERRDALQQSRRAAGQKRG